MPLVNALALFFNTIIAAAQALAGLFGGLIR